MYLIFGDPHLGACPCGWRGSTLRLLKGAQCPQCGGWDLRHPHRWRFAVSGTAMAVVGFVLFVAGWWFALDPTGPIAALAALIGAGLSLAGGALMGAANGES